MNSIDPARRRDLEAAVRHHRAGRLREAVAAYENLLRVTPEWRWLLERSDSPWYPTYRLFRQRRRGNWQSVTTAMADALRSLASERSRQKQPLSATANDRPRPNRAPCTARPS